MSQLFRSDFGPCRELSSMDILQHCSIFVSRCDCSNLLNHHFAWICPGFCHGLASLSTWGGQSFTLCKFKYHLHNHLQQIGKSYYYCYVAAKINLCLREILMIIQQTILTHDVLGDLKKATPTFFYWKVNCCWYRIFVKCKLLCLWQQKTSLCLQANTSPTNVNI